MDKISLITIVVISINAAYGTINSKSSSNLDLSDFRWLNEPKSWNLEESKLQVETDDKTDFWQDTWFNFSHNSGHVYGVQVKGDFTMEICVEANLTTQYDQAGLMIYLDEKHWLIAGIENINGQQVIGSVLTNGVSDGASGLYTGDPQKVWLRLSKVGDVVVVKYSTDNSNWHLLRICQFPAADSYFVGPMCCTPMRAGLGVKFSGLKIVEPAEDIFHAN